MEKVWYCCWPLLAVDVLSAASFMPDLKQRDPPLPTRALQRSFRRLVQPEAKKIEGTLLFLSGNGK